MKLVLATPLFPPQSGGPATDAALLQARLPSYGIETVVCNFGDVRHLPTGIRHVVYARRLFRLCKDSRGEGGTRNEAGVDGIVAFDTFSVLLPAVIVGKLLKKPVIVRVPGDFAWEQATQRYGVKDSIEKFQTKCYDVRVEVMRSVQKYAARSAALLVVPSDYFGTIVSQWGISSEKIKRIYLGIDLDEKATMPSEAILKTVGEHSKILFSLGRFVPWKGFGMLIDLMKDMPDEWHLVLAGDGPLQAELEDHARKLEEKVQATEESQKDFQEKNEKRKNRVTFLGAIPHDEVLGWLARADAFALNTSFESFSFQVVEAMASGTPVITTPIGSLPELITNGVEGVLCTPDDEKAFLEAILSTQTNSHEWQKRTDAAQAKAQKFSTKASLDAFVEEVTKICA
jgi:glycosyltransferase involved in cell wall biosynthesis